MKILDHASESRNAGFGRIRADRHTPMKKTLFAFVILAAGSAFAADVSIGIQIGAPPPPRVLAVRPVAPAPEFVWVEGYWYPVGHRYHWHEGYWTRPPFEGAIWVGPHHDGARFFAGYWDSPRGRFEHDHHWDRGHDRDFRHEWKEHDHDDHGHGHDRDHDRH
jgi:hypothetical protein